MAYALELKNLTKQYKTTTAVNAVNLRLEENKIYGLLGRNGAGKTTILNMLTARIFPTGGEALVFGEPAFENIPVLRKICLIEEKGFYDSAVRVKDVLRLTAQLYPNWDEAYAQQLLATFSLDANKKYKQLSRGMETAMGLIIGLASRAPLTIFDEPSLGLDAVVRERFYDEVIADYTRHPRTFVISTHLIDEISRIFEEVVIIDAGRLLVQENTEALKEKAYFLSGKREAVAQASEGTILLHEEHFGSTLIRGVYATKRMPSIPGVQVQPIPLQKLFVFLCEPDVQQRLAKGGVIQ